MTPDRYRDQHVLVTGAGQGLGAAMARRFAAEGAHVLVADIDADSSAVVTDTIRVEGGSASAHVLDVTDTAAVDALVARQNRIDVLVNNAGIIRDNRVENISDEDWHAVVDVNLTGAFALTRAVLPRMRAAGYGRILSFSSMSWRGNYGQANYVAAKAGVVGLTRALALEGARDGITANAVAPGLIETPMLASMNARAREKLVSRIPMRHTGDPTDIAEAAAFLCSPGARYVTGVVLDVDGGISIGSAIR